MSLVQLIVVIAVVLFVLIMILFPEARVLIKGFVSLFIKDRAATPEGAQAIFDQKISQAQDSYAKANTAMKQAVGRLSTTRNKLAALKSDLAECEKQCESLVKLGDLEAAGIKAEQREDLISSIARQEKLLAAYQTAADTATEVHAACEKNLRDLQREAKETVENMKTKEQLASIYNESDRLMQVTATDKLLDAVRQKNQDLDELAEGSRVVHNAKASTRQQKADEKARKAHSSDYLEGLKKKYNK